MRGIGPASSPLLRAAASILLAIACLVGTIGGTISGPRLADDLASFIGTSDGVLAQTVRLKPAKPPLSPSGPEAETDDAALAHPIAALGAGAEVQAGVMPERCAPTPPCPASPPIRAPPRSL